MFMGASFFQWFKDDADPDDINDEVKFSNVHLIPLSCKSHNHDVSVFFHLSLCVRVPA